MSLKYIEHARRPPDSLLFGTVFNKDIIDRDTLLLTVSPTPIWHPLEKWFAARRGHKAKSARAS